MDIHTIQTSLEGLPIASLRYFESIGSTNDEALRWAAAGASDGSLVIADAQTQGRGRLGRRWITRPGSSLAFSLIVHPNQAETARLAYFSPLAALSVCRALEQIPQIATLVKWPNDVLVNQRKAAGVLVEVNWVGDQLQSVVIGVGINVGQDAVPPADELLFPATSIEEAAGQPVDRLFILRETLKHLFDLRASAFNAETEPAFFDAWEERLAYKGEWVRIEGTGGKTITGQVIGLDRSGSLLLKTPAGKLQPIAVGDVRLRLVD
jgi:BirA family transcriptional regulator, biotin operon repressor / biotin---[acetyl-CoA-carboxylase] ligase